MCQIPLWSWATHNILDTTHHPCNIFYTLNFSFFTMSIPDYSRLRLAFQISSFKFCVIYNEKTTFGCSNNTIQFTQIHFIEIPTEIQVTLWIMKGPRVMEPKSIQGPTASSAQRALSMKYLMKNLKRWLLIPDCHTDASWAPVLVPPPVVVAESFATLMPYPSCSGGGGWVASLLRALLLRGWCCWGGWCCCWGMASLWNEMSDMVEVKESRTMDSDI